MAILITSALRRGGRIAGTRVATMTKGKRPKGKGKGKRPAKRPVPKAAGTGGRGRVFHGRRGDGITLSLDLAPCTSSAGPADRRTWNLFHGRAAGVGEAARVAAITATVKAKGSKGRGGEPQNPATSKKARRMLAEAKNARRLARVGT